METKTTNNISPIETMLDKFIKDTMKELKKIKSRQQEAHQRSMHEIDRIVHSIQQLKAKKEVISGENKGAKKAVQVMNQQEHIK